MNTEDEEFNRIERESKMRKQAVESALNKMAENARELGLDYEPAGGTQVSKVWWDGEKLMAKPIPFEDIYQPTPVQELAAWAWRQAPIKTMWGDEMVVADLAIDKDHTVSVYCERDQAAKVEAMFTQPAAPVQEPSIPEGWERRTVVGFNALVEALDYAERKGFMPDYMADVWEGFNYLAAEKHAQPAAQPAPNCTRSHPHENMDAMCELRTEIARLTNENARLKAAASVQEPADDGFTQALIERDEYHAIADELAEMIAQITGEDIGEHTSANFPWRNALDAAENWLCHSPAAPVQEPVAFKIYKPTPPRGAIPDVRDAELPWVYDQDPSSGNVASMWVTPVKFKEKNT